MGTLDGPGIRYVLFLQGCPLRCPYCHNPEAHPLNGGVEYTLDEIERRVLGCKDYFGDNGGVTVSGGEVLSQAQFTAELFARLKKAKIHTAIDTSGIGNLEDAKRLLKVTDLVICDIKYPSDEGYIEKFGGTLSAVREFLDETEKFGNELWIRHVVVPGLTDGEETVREVIRIAMQYENLTKIELLPYSRLSVTKYEQMGLEYPLGDTPECSSELIEKLSELIPEKYR